MPPASHGWRILALALGRLAPVTAQSGTELLLVGACPTGSGFDCSTANNQPSDSDLIGCIGEPDQLELTFNDATIAHNNLGWRGCNMQDLSGDLWDNCQGSASLFCKVGANTAIGEIEAIGHEDNTDDTVIDPITQWPTMVGNSDLSDRGCTSAPTGTFIDAYVDVDNPGSGSLESGHCINKFDFIGRANDNCREGMIFDNVSPQEPNLQLRIETYYALFRDPITNEALSLIHI